MAQMRPPESNVYASPVVTASPPAVFDTPRDETPLAPTRSASLEWYALVVGTSVLVLLGACLALATLADALDVRIGAWILLPAAAAQAAAVAVACRSHDPGRTVTRCVAVLAGVWAGLAGLAGAVGFVRDTSIVGRHYQGESVFQLVAGWNPLRSHALPSSIASPYLYTNTYGKALWQLQAIAIRSGATFEQAKVTGVALVAASLLIGFAYLRRIGLARWSALVVAGLLACNPISMAEITTHMVDGALASLLLIVVLLVLLDLAGEAAVAVVPALVAALVLLVNAKATGVVLAIIVAGATSLVALARSSPRRFGTWRLPLYVAGAIAGGVVAIGYNPYVTNTIRNGNPFYPAVGKDSHDLLRPVEVGRMQGASSPVRLVYSVLARSGGGTSIKLPFDTTLSEFNAFRKVSVVSFGGFGPLYSGVLLLAALATAIVLVRRVRRRQPLGSVTVALFVVCACSVVASFAISASFVSRFAPQLWMIPVLACTACLVAHDRARSARWIAVVALALLLADGVVVAGASLDGQVRRSRVQNENLARLRENSPYTVELGSWPSAERRRLDQYHVRYTVVDHLTCAHPLSLAADGSVTRQSSDVSARAISGALLCKVAK
jgi:hypothetical protein